MKLEMKRLEAGHWFSMNGMITNPDKYQAMILGNTTIPLVLKQMTPILR